MMRRWAQICCFFMLVFFFFSAAARCGAQKGLSLAELRNFSLEDIMQDFNGKWTKGLSSVVNSNVYISVDTQKKEFYYSYSINDCFTSFDASGKLKSPPEKDHSLNFYVTDWEGVVKKDDRIEFYGKIRYGKYDHGALGAIHDHELISSDKQITLRDAVENANTKPNIASQILDKPPTSDAIYAFVSIKKLSENTYDVFLWGGPDVTTNAPVYAAYHKDVTTSDGVVHHYPESPEFAAEKAKFPLAKDSVCHTVFLVQKAWVGFSDTPAVLSKTSYTQLKDLALKYGKTTYGVYTRVKE